MTQKAIDILKARWPEVVMVVVLQAAMVQLLEGMVSDSEKMNTNAVLMPFWASFLLGMGAILFAILWQMLYLGFLKTAAESETRPQQPMELLRSGRPYFWRIVFFQMMLGFALMFLNIVIASSLRWLLWPDSGFDQLPPWFPQLCALLGILVVLKPMLLVPARMIVYDDPVFQAVSQVRYYRLAGIDRIYRITFWGFGLIVLSMVPMAFFQEGTVFLSVFTVLYHVVFSFIVLLLTLVAVLWVQRQFDAEYPEMDEEQEII